MANLRVQGGAPVSICDSNGNQYVVPLSLLAFSPTGSLVADSWLNGLSSAHKATLSPLLAAWLQNLAGQGLINPSAMSVSPPAFVAAARDLGSQGNNIKVVIANVAPNGPVPSQTAVDVTISTTQTYAGLSLSSISGVLGTKTTAGTQPGLAQVSNVGTALPTATTAPLSFGGTPAQLAVPAASGAAFTLVPTHPETNASLVQVAISAVDTTKNVFTMTLTWTLSANQLALASLASEFGYLVSITPPAGGFAYPPSAATYVLQGGTDAHSGIPATAAQAVVVAG
jgi:hypothetical protein